MKTNQECPTRLLPELLNNGLTVQESESVELHLESCEDCRALLTDEAGGTAFWSAVSELSDDQLDRDWLGTGSSESEAVDPEVARESRLQAIFESIKPLLGPSDDPQSAGRIGNYEVTGLIGSGGMGVVVKAKDQSLDRIVAIKMLAPHLAMFETSRLRFQREAKAAAAVQHDGIISIHVVSSHNGVPYFVMPYEAGPSLQQRIERQGRLSVEETLRVASQIANALNAAHQTGLVHRDIKPSNILLAPGTERALLSDFGLAQVCDQQNITQTGLVAGTPMFMSPEQARGETVDSRSDLFSLGSVIFMMLTGKPPVSGDNGYSIVRQIGGHPMPALRSVDSELPEWLERLVSRLHELDPEDRILSAAELAQLLSQSLAHVQNPSEHDLPSTLVTKPRSSRASIVIATLIGAVVVCLLVAMTQGWLARSAPIPSNVPNEATQSSNTSEKEIKLDKAVPEKWDDDLDLLIHDIRVRIERLETEQNYEEEN